MLARTANLRNTHKNFYLQMVDKEDEFLMQMNWMQRWISYQDKVNSQADEPTPMVREGSR